MGTLTPPTGSRLYLDTSCIIYSVEHIEPYAGLLTPVWQGATSGDFALRTRGLTLPETLVGPLKAGDTVLADVYRQLLQQSTEVQLVAVSELVLEQAAVLRATSGRQCAPEPLQAPITGLRSAQELSPASAGSIGRARRPGPHAVRMAHDMVEWMV